MNSLRPSFRFDKIFHFRIFQLPYLRFTLCLLMSQAYLFANAITSDLDSFEEESREEKILAVPDAVSELTAVTISNNVIALSWVDNSTVETGFKIERSLSSDSGFESVAILEANSTYLLDGQLDSATTYFYRVIAFNNEGDSGISEVVSATTGSDAYNLPHYWTKTDIDHGTQRENGRLSYEAGEYAIVGYGELDTNDEFTYVYQPLKGDGEIVGQLIQSGNARHHIHSLMIRESLDSGANYVAHQYTKDRSEIAFVASEAGQEILNVVDSEEYTLSLWMKLERSGDLFTTSVSKDGTNWTQIHQNSTPMGENVLIGFAAYSNEHSSDGNGNPRSSIGTWKDVIATQSSDQFNPPTNLVANPGAIDDITLTWTDNSDNETGFRIERAPRSSDLRYETLAEVGTNATSYTDAGLNPGVYFYRVRAINDGGQSVPSNEVVGEIFLIPNIILKLERKIGDEDRTANANIIEVEANEDTVPNVLRYPGMNGKNIDVTLASTVSSESGAISFKIMPTTHQQTVEFFSSEFLSISQVASDLSVTVNGNSQTYDVLLDSATCNQVVLNFHNGIMTPFINGVYFDDLDVGSFDLQSFTLNEFNGNLWGIIVTDIPMTDDAIHGESARCTNGVEAIDVPSEQYSFRICGVYQCLWVDAENLLNSGKKRGYLAAQEIAFDKNIFDYEMYDHKEGIQSKVDRDRNIIASGGFEYFGLGNLFTTNQNNTAFWIHENFHSYQAPLLGGGKWLAEASAEWAVWNFYKEPIPGTSIGAFTLNPHMGIFETFPFDSEDYHEVVRFYHSSIMLVYMTTYYADQRLMGRLYNNPEVEGNAFNTMIADIESNGHDFDQIFAEFAIRTAMWDYPIQEMSEAYKANERKALNNGLPDLRFAGTLTETGTYGIYQPAPEHLLPGDYGWNSYKIDSTAASTYTIKLKGSDQNPESLRFTAKVAKGTPGNYEYFDVNMADGVPQGSGEAQFEVETNAGDELYLTLLTTSGKFMKNENIDFFYEYSIESSEHILPGDHIRRFTLEQQTDFALIDHENFIVSIEVERGTDVTQLTPILELTEGATSSPASGDAVDFTDPVTYMVTSPDGSTTKEWKVVVSVVPDRTDTDILTFELKNLVPFSTVDKLSHLVFANIVSDIDLTAVEPVFTLSEGATSVPASGEIVDLTNPVVYTVTAEDGVTQQEWIISAKEFTPFITAFKTESANEEIAWNSSKHSDFKYTWKDANGEVVESGIWAPEGEDINFVSTLPEAGSYTLEISGYFPSLRSESLDKLVDVIQWGDVEWESMVLSFQQWKGEKFSATDLPRTEKVTNMFGMFRKAEFFNDDLSQWDVSQVVTMDDMFKGAKSFNGDLSQWDVSNLESANGMFREARAFNSDISLWNTENLREMFQMFRVADGFDHNLGNWNMRSASNMVEALNGVGLSVANYDRTLIGWSRQNLREEVDFGAGGLKYCGSEAARDILINEWQWDIAGDEKVCENGSGTNILLFELADQSAPATYDDVNKTVSINVYATADLTALIPEIIVSDEATISPASDVVQDFTNPVIYTVTAADGVTQEDWTVSVTRALSSETDMFSFELAAQTGPALVNLSNHTISIEVESGTDITNLVPTIVLSNGATSSPAIGSAVDFTEPVIYTITAEDGVTTQDWVVSVTVEKEVTALSEELQLPELKVFPNPVSETLKVISSTSIGVRLIDLRGKELIAPIRGTELELDMSLLHSGLYILLIEDGEHVYSKSVLKEK